MIIVIYVNFFVYVIFFEVYLLKKKGFVYILIVCDFDEDKYIFFLIILLDF